MASEDLPRQSVRGALPALFTCVPHRALTLAWGGRRAARRGSSVHERHSAPEGSAGSVNTEVK